MIGIQNIKIRLIIENSCLIEKFNYLELKISDYNVPY